MHFFYTLKYQMSMNICNMPEANLWFLATIYLGLDAISSYDVMQSFLNSFVVHQIAKVYSHNDFLFKYKNLQNKKVICLDFFVLIFFLRFTSRFDKCIQGNIRSHDLKEILRYLVLTVRLCKTCFASYFWAYLKISNLRGYAISIQSIASVRILSSITTSVCTSYDIIISRKNLKLFYFYNFILCNKYSFNRCVSNSPAVQ